MGRIKGSKNKVKTPEITEPKLNNQSGNCEVIIEMPNGIFKGEGATTAEAFLNVPLDFMAIKYKGIIKLNKDGKTTERFFQMPELRRMFATKIAKQMWANRLEKFLK